MIGSAQLVAAEEETPKFDPVVKSEDTNIGIAFESDGATKPVEGPYKGVLTLVHVPKAFEFGKHNATGALLTYDGLGFGAEDEKQWLVVSDDRDNDKVGTGVDDPNSKRGDSWTLKASMDQLKSGDEVLPATLIMSFNDVMNYALGNNTDGNGDYIPNPATDDFITAFAEGATHGVTLNNSVTLEPGVTDEFNILTKERTDGEKVGIATQISDTKLNVQAPKTAAGKNYTSKITWTLSTGIEE